MPIITHVQKPLHLDSLELQPPAFSAPLPQTSCQGPHTHIVLISHMTPSPQDYIPYHP